MNNSKIVIGKDLNYLDCLILAGGLGTRLSSLSTEKPKVLLPINDKPFIDIIIDYLRSFGIRNFIVCVGYKKEQVIRHFNISNCEYAIKFSEEEESLGTGGALKNAMSSIISETFIVMNGDSICNVNFRDLVNFHISKNALLSMVLVRSLTSKDYGTVILDNYQRVISFNEKTVNNKESLINAGIYIMQKDILHHMPKRKVLSLEYDLFPKLCNDRFYGFIVEGEVIDIGTPERYEKAVDILARHLIIR